MNIDNMTRKEFDTVPYREAWNKEVLCDGIVLLPLKHKHDSGYRCMDFVAINENEPVCRLSGCSDVLHIDGIGGFGRWSVKTGIPTSKPVISWNIDCLPKSGLFRLWAGGKKILCSTALSSFEIYAVKE